jgi:hypothetical protein
LFVDDREQSTEATKEKEASDAVVWKAKMKVHSWEDRRDVFEHLINKIYLIK